MADSPDPSLTHPLKGLSKKEIYIVAGAAVLIGGFMVYRQHAKTGSWNPFASSTATASNSSSTSIDPITGLAYSDDNATDPATGQTYLAEAQQYGTVAAAEASVGAFGQSTATGSGIPVNPASPASSGSVNTVVGTSVYTSNAAWAQAVQAGLSDVSGSSSYDGTDIGTALGDYLTQQPLTPAQIQVVNTAIAEYGPAPVGNLQVIAAPAAKPAAPTAAKTGLVPSVAGETAAAAHDHLVARGFKSSGGISGNTIIESTTPAAGATAPLGSTVKLNPSKSKLPKTSST